MVHKRVPEAVRRSFESLVTRSIEHGYGHRDDAYATMKRHAQELDERAIWSHVELYVNEWSLHLGDTGRAAFERLREVVF